MTNVKNHKSRALPYGGLSKKMFENFRVSFISQYNQQIDGNFTEHLSDRGISISTTDNEESEEEGDEAQSQDYIDMNVNNAPHNEEIPPSPSSFGVPPQNPLPY